MAHKQKMREDQKKLQEAKAKASGKGPMGTHEKVLPYIP